MLKAAREEGREEVQELLRKFGFKTVRDLESTLDAAEQMKREKEKAAEKARPKDDADDAARIAAQAERELRETLLDAGVKRADLDLAVSVMARKVQRMSEAELAKYEPEDFAKEFKASNPQSFRDYDPDKAYRDRREAEVKAENERLAAEKKAADDAKAKQPPVEDKPADPPPAADKATTGLPTTTPAKPTEKATFNAMKASKEEVAKRMAEIKILAAKPAVFTEWQ